MPNATWDKAKQIFDELTDVPAGVRTVLLDRACNGDAELRASVEKLLAANERAGEFLRQPTLHAATLIEAAERSRIILSDTRASGGDPRAADRSEDAQRGPSDVGRRIGRYKLLEVIGEGGFGTVYMAEQVEPVRRRVALKIIKPGMDSHQIVARFEAERQALALMDHPNIAKVLDGGETESRRPYFVMELVRGVPITQFCDDQRLTTRERLNLFLPVCQAVQHAHQKGIIHRDIKPSNVLVTLHDGKPVPMVIDFGIAKAMHTPLTEKTLFTEFRQLIGTPTYMSPEQAEMSGLDVDTRSDIYSLGVLLYELLTGSTPFDVKKLMNAGYAELQRTIKEVEPPRPSTRVSSAAKTGSQRIHVQLVGSSMRLADERESRGAGRSDMSRRAGTSTINDIAHFRRTDPHSLSRLLRGDLDWIVMKCLEKDRSGRFGTASDLEADLGRYLRDEPVVARPPSTLYRLGKLARRNRAAVFAAAAIVVALGVGFALSVAGFVAARNSQHFAEAEERKAETQAGAARRAAAKAEAINKFLLDTFASADPAVSGKREITVRESLDTAVAKLDGGALKAQPEVEGKVRITIGQTYMSLARLDAAKKQLDAAADLLRAAGGDNLDYALALFQRADALKLLGDPRQAELEMREALEINRRLRGPEDAVIAANLNDLGTILQDQGRYDDAKPLFEEALTIARLPENAQDSVLGDILNNSHFYPKQVENWPEAEKLLREALAVNRRVLGAVHPHIATNLDNIAQMLERQGDRDGAEHTYREALAMRRELFGSDHPDVAYTLHNLATLLWRKGEPAETETALREALDIFRRIHGLANPDTLTVVDSLVSVVGARKDFAAAEALLREVFDAIKDDASIPDARKAGLANGLAAVYAVQKKTELSESWRQTARRFATSQPAP